MRLRGILVALSYHMNRHHVLGLPWIAWLFVAPIAIALGVVVHLWGLSGWAAGVGALLLLAGTILVASGRGGWEAVDPDTAASPPWADALAAGKRMPMRATGWFEIREMRRRYVSVSGYYETFETREHVVMVKQKQTRFLLFGQSPKEETGWWYTFFCPAHVLDVAGVHQSFGLARHPALKLLVRTQSDKVPLTLLLAFDSAADRDQVWADLRWDALQSR